MDGSGRLNAHEFALMRRALVTFSSERDSNISEVGACPLYQMPEMEILLGFWQ